MNPANQIRIGVLIASTAWGVAVYLSGGDIDGGMRRVLAYLPTAATFGAVVFDTWLWHTRPLLAALGRPDLRGTWLATIQPSEDSHIPEGGNRGPIEAAVVIEQTFWTISLHLMTAQSSSSSTAAVLRKRDDSRARHQLVYTYANTPRQEHQPRSWSHSGASELEIVGRQPDTVAGNYWTARLTVGDMQLSRFDAKTDYADFAAVKAAVEAKDPPEQWP